MTSEEKMILRKGYIINPTLLPLLPKPLPTDPTDSTDPPPYPSTREGSGMFEPESGQPQGIAPTGNALNLEL